jgi:hypothetical protein
MKYKKKTVNDKKAFQNEILFWIFVALVLATSAFLLFKYFLPFRLTSTDIFQQMADVKVFLNTSHIYENPYFSGGNVDLHSGPYYYFMYILTVLLNITIYKAMLIFINFWMGCLCILGGFV